MITTKVKLKSLMKDLLPPITLRLVKSFRSERTPTKGQEQPPEYYNRVFSEEERWHKHYTQSGYYPLWAVIADRIKHANINSMLEIACGTGQMALLLHDNMVVQRYLGFDFSSEAIKFARQRYKNIICSNFDFAVADAFKTDLFHNHNYDTVLCTEFLEHVERDLEVIGKIRSGTRFYGSVPNYSYRSHVRFFKSSDEVMERYEKYFHSLSVDAYLRNPNGTKIYILEGIKR